MKSPKQKIYDLHQDILNICQTYRCDNWSNFWCWDKQQNNLIYHHLTYMESDGTFHYKNINGVSIEIEYNNYNNKYRIDIKTSYKQHNFWEFTEKEWLNVELYVKTIITLQYNYLQKFNSLLNLTNDAYMDIQPKKMYDEMTYKQRKLKLKQINEKR